MTDDLRLLDDPLDAEVGDLLRGLDRGPVLRVDVDAVIAAGARRRRLVIAERVLAVAATVAVVVGVGVFALGRGSSSPVPAPAVSPTQRALAPAVEDWPWYSIGDHPNRRALAVASVQNTSTEAVTVQAPVVAGGEQVRAVLTDMIPADPAKTVIGLEDLARLDQPAPASVVLLPGRSLLVVIEVRATCGPADSVTSTTVTLPLRSASGVEGRFALASQQGHNQDWERTALHSACTKP